MKLKQVNLGIHTIELYAGKLKYYQIQKTIDHLVEHLSGGSGYPHAPASES